MHVIVNCLHHQRCDTVRPNEVDIDFHRSIFRALLSSTTKPDSGPSSSSHLAEVQDSVRVPSHDWGHKSLQQAEDSLKELKHKANHLLQLKRIMVTAQHPAKLVCELIASLRLAHEVEKNGLQQLSTFLETAYPVVKSGIEQHVQTLQQNTKASHESIQVLQSLESKFKRDFRNVTFEENHLELQNISSHSERQMQVQLGMGTQKVAEALSARVRELNDEGESLSSMLQ